MSPLISRSASALALIVACACASTPRINLQSEEQAIRDLNRRWLEAVAAKDVATIVALHAPDALHLIPNGPPIRGTDAIRAAWTELVGMQNISLTFAPTRIEVAQSGDLATNLGTYREAYDGPAGRVEGEGDYNLTWKKQPTGEWKVIANSVTSRTPIPMPAAAGDVVLVIEPPGDQMTMSAGAGVAFTDLSVPGFNPGVKLAVIHGDPMGKGDYTIRLKFPDGYNFPAHFHPNAEHLTVLSGTFMLGMGDRADPAKLATYRPGDFLYMPAKKPHFGGVKGETVIQLHGIGPFEIRLANAP